MWHNARLITSDNKYVISDNFNDHFLVIYYDMPQNDDPFVAFVIGSLYVYQIISPIPRKIIIAMEFWAPGNSLRLLLVRAV